MNLSDLEKVGIAAIAGLLLMIGISVGRGDFRRLIPQPVEAIKFEPIIF